MSLLGVKEAKITGSTHPPGWDLHLIFHPAVYDPHKEASVHMSTSGCPSLHGPCTACASTYPIPDFGDTDIAQGYPWGQWVGEVQQGGR